MKKNLFEIGSKFEDGWSSDNKTKEKKSKKIELKEPSKHKLTLSKEKRRGKIVTVVKEFHIEDKELNNLLKSLKKSLGCGGTVKENRIELQGDIAQKAKDAIVKLGFKFK